MPYFRWAASARTEIRDIGPSQARNILQALTRYAQSGEGDVSALKGATAGRVRLRSGDYRVIFRRTGVDTFQILSVGHRKEIYRG